MFKKIVFKSLFANINAKLTSPMAIKIGVMVFFNFCFHFRANTKTNVFFIKKTPQMLKKTLLIRTLFLVIFVIFTKNARQYESLFSRLHL